MALKVGYNASAEQFGPRGLVEYAVRAEGGGGEFEFFFFGGVRGVIGGDGVDGAVRQALDDGQVHGFPGLFGQGGHLAECADNEEAVVGDGVGGHPGDERPQVVMVVEVVLDDPPELPQVLEQPVSGGGIVAAVRGDLDVGVQSVTQTFEDI